MDMVRQIKTIYDNYGFRTEIIVASVRHPLYVLESVLASADVATVPMDVMQQLYNHPMSDVIMAQFNNDWAKVPGK